MNFARLRDIFENNTGVTSEVDDIQLAFWFNEAMLDLAYDLGEIKSAALNTGDALPSDCLKVTSGNRLGADGKVINSGTVYYRSMPEDLTGADAEIPALHQATHYLLPLFASYRYWLKESEGDAEEIGLANYWLGLYQQGKQNTINKLSSVISPDRWTIE